VTGGSWNGSFLEGLLELGLNYIDMTIAVVSLFILLAVSIIQRRIEEGKCVSGITCVRELIDTKPYLLQLFIWFALLFYVILLGQYGPGYDAAEFIYQGF